MHGQVGGGGISLSRNASLTVDEEWEAEELMGNKKSIYHRFRSALLAELLLFSGWPFTVIDSPYVAAATALTNRPARSHRWIWQFRHWREIIIPPHNEQQQQQQQRLQTQKCPSRTTKRKINPLSSAYRASQKCQARSICWYHYPFPYRHSFHRANARTFGWQWDGAWRFWIRDWWGRRWFWSDSLLVSVA